MLRWIFGGIVCLLCGGYLLFRYFSGHPALDQLDKIEGEVSSAQIEERRTRRSTSQVLAVRIGDNPPAYYLERFPDFERVGAAVGPGDQVIAWVDVGKNNYIWQLEKQGERLISYEQVAEAQRSNDFWNAMFGILFIMVGLGALGSQILGRRTSAPTAPA
jgi:hypothetical protein